MKLLFFILCLQSTFGDYKITFGPKNNYFDNGTISNPYSRLIYGTNRSDLIICYGDTDASPKGGLCEIGVLDVPNQKITFSDQYQFDAPASDAYERQLVSADGPLTNILVGYTNGPDSSTGPGKLVVGQYVLAESAIKYGIPQTFNVGDNDQSNIIELERNESYFAVCYSVGSRDQKGTGCRLGQYDTTALTVKFGSKFYTAPFNGPTDGMAVSTVLGNGTFLLCFSTGGGAVGECTLGQVPGLDTNGIDSDIIFSKPVIFNQEGETDNIQINRVYNNVSDPDNDPNAIVCYISKNDGACSYLIVDMDNAANPLQFQNRIQFAANDVIDQPSVQLIPPGQIGNTAPVLMICYVDINRNVNKETAGCKFGDIDLEKYNIAFGTQISNFEFDGADRLDALYLGGSNMIVCYVDGTENKNRAPCLFGVISSV